MGVSVYKYPSVLSIFYLPWIKKGDGISRWMSPL